MVKHKQTPMYWQNGSYASKTGHKIERDLDSWFREQYAKHHSQKSGAFSVGELTKAKDESNEHHG
ncbi:hypothetical protein RA16_06880 [Levilactobacillus brevis]|uniref:hypothetical protein n=1 Tax=Levilactobacillus brevis TaxID=1580 RepID=UPI0005B63740|nr:hypothetical protein [Levilactobacillus brevis]KIR08694.1 hypothetical protein RA16_06880 [Levilactobacillus brevis]